MKDELTKARKQNMKIYPLYRAISLDLIFYYAIEFLFLTQVKNISSADVVLGQAFYAIFMMILQIPASIVVDKVGTKKCTVLANVFNCIFIILIMCCKDLKSLIFAQFMSAMCYSLKDISDRALINFSIPKCRKEGEIFSRLEGRATKDYYLLNAITALLSGYLYLINPYIPMVGALAFTILSVFMSLGFKEIGHNQPKEEVEKSKKRSYWKDLGDAMDFIFNSQRLRSLFLCGGVAWGIFCLMSTYRTSLLVDIGTPEYIITAIAAIVGIAASIGSKKQLQFHRCFRNKSLSAILLFTTFSVWISGIMGVMNVSYGIKLTIITICFSIINAAKGIEGVITGRYLGNFANKRILTQILAVNAIGRNIFRAIIGFLGSYLLRITNTANSNILIGIILFVSVLGLISYMKTRLGLKPDQYDENEIYGKKKYEIKKELQFFI